MQLTQLIHRSLLFTLATTCVTVSTAASAAPLEHWDGYRQGTFGYSWGGTGRSGVVAVHSVTPDGAFSSTDHVWAPSLYAGGTACFEMVTVHHSDGHVYLTPHDWCGGGGFQPGIPMNAAFKDKYVRIGKYYIKVEQTNATTNTWEASLFNHQTQVWEQVYSKGGVHDGDESGGWDYFEVFTEYNDDKGMGDYCDRLAGYEFSAKILMFKIDGQWVAPNSTNMTTIGSTVSEDYGCPALTLTRPSATEWQVTIPSLGCTVAPTLTPLQGGYSRLRLEVHNTNAYPVNGWTLTALFDGAPTITAASGATYSQTGNFVTATNPGSNLIIAPGGAATFDLYGAQITAIPSQFVLGHTSALTTGTCTVQ